MSEHETVEAQAFLNHLLGLAGRPPGDPLLAEVVAERGLADRQAYTAAEMTAIETALAQKIQFKLAVSNNPDVAGLQALILNVNRLVGTRRDP